MHRQAASQCGRCHFSSSLFTCYVRSRYDRTKGNWLPSSIIPPVAAQPLHSLPFLSHSSPQSLNPPPNPSTEQGPFPIFLSATQTVRHVLRGTRPDFRYDDAEVVTRFHCEVMVVQNEGRRVSAGGGRPKPTPMASCLGPARHRSSPVAT